MRYERGICDEPGYAGLDDALFIDSTSHFSCFGVFAEYFRFLPSGPKIATIINPHLTHPSHLYPSHHNNDISMQ